MEGMGQCLKSQRHSNDSFLFKSVVVKLMTASTVWSSTSTDPSFATIRKVCSVQVTTAVDPSKCMLTSLMRAFLQILRGLAQPK